MRCASLGMAVLRSLEPVTLGQWHRVVAERLNKDGSLKVDQAQEVRRSSPGKAQGLNIHTPMYLGGVPNMDIPAQTCQRQHAVWGLCGWGKGEPTLSSYLRGAEPSPKAP